MVVQQDLASSSSERLSASAWTLARKRESVAGGVGSSSDSAHELGNARTKIISRSVACQDVRGNRSTFS